MKTITISTENNETFSTISNFFIDYYMTDANGEFVKIYLYLVRLLQHGKGVTVAEIADHFNLTENDICRAIRHWISKGVLRFKYDDNKQLSGIIILPLQAPATDMDLELDAVSLLKSDSDKVQTKKNAKVAEVTKYDFVNKTSSEVVDKTSTQEIISSEISVPDVPVFTKKDIETKLRDEDWECLTYQIETYFGRPLTNSETTTLMYLHDTLEFNVDLLEYLVEYCLTLGKKSFKYIQAVAIQWYKDGIKDFQTAKENCTVTSGLINIVYKELGIKNRSCPTQTELSFINTWNKDYGMSPELIRHACQKAIATRPNSANFNYVNGIIESWHKNNVKTISDVDKLDKAFAATASAKKAANGNNTNNVSSFNNFKQTKLDSQLDEMEQLLLNEVNRQ